MQLRSEAAVKVQLIRGAAVKVQLVKAHWGTLKLQVLWSYKPCKPYKPAGCLHALYDHSTCNFNVAQTSSLVEESCWEEKINHFGFMRWHTNKAAAVAGARSAVAMAAAMDMRCQQ